MHNECRFSRCRRYRYTLLHRWDELFPPRRRAIFICLNPSTADEVQLDNTLRRIQGFSQREGYNEFLMLNAFAFRATDPREMKAAADPVGPENDSTIENEIRMAAAMTPGSSGHVVVGWGTHCSHLARSQSLTPLIRSVCAEVSWDLVCLGTNADGSPKHPLYISSETAFQIF